QNERYNAKKLDERLRDHSWFIAFAPADAPRIAVAVIEENGGAGARAAAPIARKVLDAYLLGPDGKLKPAAAPNDVAPVPAPAAQPASPPLPPHPQVHSIPATGQKQPA
ncbi:MAG: penicillin-binding transpeptidase domain-containing protein, partial [Steroidobacteraceae bacterium]